MIDNDHVYSRRKNAWPVHPELQPAEQQCQRYVSHYSRPHVIRADSWTSALAYSSTGLEAKDSAQRRGDVGVNRGALPGLALLLL